MRIFFAAVTLLALSGTWSLAQDGCAQCPTLARDAWSELEAGNARFTPENSSRAPTRAASPAPRIRRSPSASCSLRRHCARARRMLASDRASIGDLSDRAAMSHEHDAEGLLRILGAAMRHASARGLSFPVVKRALPASSSLHASAGERLGHCAQPSCASDQVPESASSVTAAKKILMKWTSGQAH